MKFRKIALATSLAIASASSFAADVQLSGFVNLVGQASDVATGTEYDFNNLTKVGVQADIKVTDKVFSTIQVVNRKNAWEREDDARETTLEYGFVGYKATEDTVLRVGRLRSPLFLLSEYVEVGSIVPWVQAPTAVYHQLPNNAHDGLDLLYSGEVGEASYTFQAFYGDSDAPVVLIGGVDGIVNMENLYGANLTVNYGDWMFRFSHGEGDISFDLSPITTLGMQQAITQASEGAQMLADGASAAYQAYEAMLAANPDQAAAYLAQSQQLQAESQVYAAQAQQAGFMLQELPVSAKTTITNIGVQGYITDNVSLMAEYVVIDSEHKVQNDDKGFYVAASYHFDDDFRLTATYADREEFTVNNSVKEDFTETMLTLGYSYTPDMLIKAEYRRFDTDEYTNGAMTAEKSDDTIALSLNYMF